MDTRRLKYWGMLGILVLSVMLGMSAVANGYHVAADSSVSVTLNQTYTMAGYTLTPQMASVKEGRYMGTYQDRQALGVILTSGSTIWVRQTNAKYTAKVTLQLIGNDTNKYQTKSVGNSWTTLTANGDQVAFLKTPQTTSSQSPKLEYQVTSGSAVTLPVFTKTSSQSQVMAAWKTSQASFALIEGNNIDILVPKSDQSRLASMNVATIISNYDDKLFPLYNEMTGYHTNTSLTDHTKAKFFVVPDVHGSGTAYYSTGRIGQTGNTVKAFLSLNWLVFHEIGHGYQVTASDMYTPESFNNIFAAIMQYQYFPSLYATGTAWIWAGNKTAAVNHAITQFSNHIKFNNLDYHPRLIWWMNMAYNLAGSQAFTQFNLYHKQLALAEQSTSNMGNLWVQFYAKYYNLNVTPYMQVVGLATASSLQSQVINLPAVAMLYQVVPDSILNNQTKLAALLKTLGQSDNPFASRALAVTNAQLAAADLTSDNVQLTLSASDYQKVAGKTLQVKNGSAVVATVKITSQTITLPTISNGIYNLKISGASISNPYLYVKDSTQMTTLKLN